MKDGWGTLTALSDGTLVTAGHVFGFPLLVDGSEVSSIDVLERGTSHAVRMGDMSSFRGDWVHFRVEPLVRAGWDVATSPPRPGEEVVIRGYVDCEHRDAPVAIEFGARLREAPAWAEAIAPGMLFAEPVEGGNAFAAHGASGGPVLISDNDSERLIGIFLGFAERGNAFLRERVWVIQPWPPAQD